LKVLEFILEILKVILKMIIGMEQSARIIENCDANLENEDVYYTDDYLCIS